MSKQQFDNKLSGASLAFQPLYKQVQEHVTQLIVEQRWKPGEMLPNEFQLASEMGVSQGTVRKALNALTDARILTRRQGVGTFVSEHTGHHALYRFFPLVADGKAMELPKAELLSISSLNDAPQEVTKALQVKSNAKLIKLERRRILADEYCLLEDIYLPHKYFAALLEEKEIPHTLYHFYQTEFNLTVHKTTDSIKAIICSDEDAERLAIPKQQPLLRVTRTAFALDGKVIECRISRCRSDHFHYLVDLD